MRQLVRTFFEEEQAQDLIEYTLLLAFVCLASAALFTQVGTSLNQIWSVTSTQASTAASVAAS